MRSKERSKVWISKEGESRQEGCNITTSTCIFMINTSTLRQQ